MSESVPVEPEATAQPPPAPPWTITGAQKVIAACIALIALGAGAITYMQRFEPRDDAARRFDILTEKVTALEKANAVLTERIEGAVGRIDAAAAAIREVTNLLLHRNGNGTMQVPPPAEGTR